MKFTTVQLFHVTSLWSWVKGLDHRVWEKMYYLINLMECQPVPTRTGDTARTGPWCSTCGQHSSTWGQAHTCAAHTRLFSSATQQLNFLNFYQSTIISDKCTALCDISLARTFLRMWYIFQWRPWLQWPQWRCGACGWGRIQHASDVGNFGHALKWKILGSTRLQGGGGKSPREAAIFM